MSEPNEPYSSGQIQLAGTPSPVLARKMSDVEVYSNTVSDGSANDNQNLQLKRLHQYMRGYYTLAIVLLLLFGAAGGYAGFKAGKKVYSSSGLIRVMAVVPKLMYSVEDKDTMPMFDSFVESQAALIQSQRVMDLAMQDRDWQSLGRGVSDRSAEDYAKEITVTHEGEILRVQAIDPDPSAAVINVRTLINAYLKIYDEQDAQSDEKRIELLRNRKTSLSAELVNRQNSILQIATAYGTDDLKALYQFQQERVDRLDTTIDEKKTLWTAANKLSSATRPSEKELTPEQMAAMSPRLANLMQQGDAIRQELAQLTAQHLGPQHERVLQEQSLLSINETQVHDLEEKLKQEHLTAPASVTSDGVTVNEQQLGDEIKSLEALRQTVNDKMLAMGADMLRIEALRNDSNEIQAERTETDHRIEQLTVEAQITGRLNVISYGDRPLGPYKDTRITFCTAGSFGGGLLGFSLVASIALLDRRLRSPDQAEGGSLNAPMLGMLPRLPEDLSDPAQAEMAAHCVHEIRTLLQIWSRRSRHRVFAITSPNPGAGKTSLTLALGASYATGNLKTLIVDCDLIAGGLTHRAELIIKRMLGQVLLREGFINQEQLDAALKVAAETGQRVGEVLLEQGVVTAGDLETAVMSQMEQPVGILDAMHGVPIEQCVAQTSIPNLQILPVGAATARDVPLLSPDALHSLMESLGERFDVVLVDTGPILGSLEASLLAGTVDGVVLVVRKGDRRPLVERAMSQLVTVGARVAGVVFNGASSNDIYTYGRASGGRSSTSANSLAVTSADAPAVTPSSYGPLTTAVANRAPTPNRNSAKS